MTLNPTSRVLGLALLAVCGGASAQPLDSGWYAGGSAGRSAATIDDTRIRGGLAGQGLGTTSIDDRDRSNGYKLFGGYQFSPYIGVEAGLVDLGRFGYTAQTTPAGSLNGDIRVRGMNLDLVGTLPLFGRLSALGRVGVASLRSSDGFSATGAARVPYANANPSQRSANLKLGAGLSYAVTDALSVRLEGERYRLKDAVGNTGHADLLSVGLVYRFGVRPPPPRMAEAPVVVAAAPPPAAAPMPPPPPPPAPPPAPAAPMRVSLSADSLFDFDKSVVKPEGRAALDKLAADLRGVRYDAIAVTGHTDRFGSHAYNMKLSQRRAEAVADYLVKAGIAAGSISAKGVDGDNPVTQPGACKGNKPTPAVVACLQPDRRVDVEVTGSR
ncbi:OmpA family protein [Caenimonas aquaedulcis]|uniref:OmpA family protein n=1 Tax=Caenimonas aquaedulcis TaxID=2793270 RepID=A0A931H652_9BURK|nr:OmpA family protein [Caenimonas aquaedulcis]MBG9389291.1 OmpA family protein [Caenimonas aquaedulcis]